MERRFVGANRLFGIALSVAVPTSYGCGEGEKTGSRSPPMLDAGPGHVPTADGSTEHVHDADGGDAASLPFVDFSASKLGQSGGFVDFDGDGILDKIVGAPHALTGPKLGVAMVYAGRGNSWVSEPTALLTGDRDFGFSFANLGDVDGDKQPDFAIGAIHGDAPEVSLSGSVHIFAGGRSGELLAKLGGEVPASKFGWAIAAGDFNGDGAADIAVGSPHHSSDPALYQSGAVFVHFGPSLTTKIVLTATAANKGLGWALTAGDINGDGVDDLLLATRPGTGGKVMGYFGSAAFAPVLGSPDIALSATATGFGNAIAVVDDLNGDGRRDLAIGAPNATIGGFRDTGSVYLAQTPASAAVVNLDATTAPLERIARIDGQGLFSRFGWSLSALADADGDGKAELAVGSPMADGEVNDMVGKVFLFWGKDLGTQTTLTSGKSFAGSVSRGTFGTFVAPNKNGYLLVGASRADADRGASYVVDLAAGAFVEVGATGESTGSIHEHDGP